MKILPMIMSCSIVLCGLTQAQDQPFEAQSTNQLTVKGFMSDQVSLEVSLERFSKKQITTTGKGEDLQTWAGSRLLPNKIKFVTPTLVKSFVVTIDGKKINVPAEHWRDLVGLNLQNAKKLRDPKQNEGTKDEFEAFLERPSICRSNDGKTAMINWSYGED